MSEIYYPNEYDKVADIPSDMKKMAESIGKALESKVDKIPGKGLSTCDYTEEEKKKLTQLVLYVNENIRQELDEINLENERLKKDLKGLPTRNSK